MGNNSSSSNPEPNLEISGPLHLLSANPLSQVDEDLYGEVRYEGERIEKRADQRIASRITRTRSVSQPPLSRPDAMPQRTRSFSRKASLHDRPTFLSDVPLDIGLEDAPQSKHAAAAAAVDYGQSDYLYSNAFGCRMDSRGDPYEELAASRITNLNERNSRQPISESMGGRRPSHHYQPLPSPSTESSMLARRTSTSSRLSLGSIRSKTSLGSRASRGSRASEPTFELVTPPSSIDAPASPRNQNIIVTTKTRVQYDFERGEWQFDDTDAKPVEPETETDPKSKKMSRVFRTLG